MRPGPLTLILAVVASLAAAAAGCGREPHRHAVIPVIGAEAEPAIELQPEPGQTVVHEAPPIRSVFNEVMLGWNVDVPPGTGLWFEIRVKTPGGDWSPWMLIGEWGDIAAPGEPVTGYEHGNVEVDVFVSDTVHELIQWRAVATRSAASTDPIRITALDVISTRTGTPPPATPPKNCPIEIEVPFRSQKTPDESLSGRLCSPTSVTMVLAARGVDLPVSQVAATAYDARHDIYGNWPRNVQAAYELGRHARLTRINSWEEAERILAAGQPLVISFSAKEGELPQAPYPSTSGHLIVLTGFTAEGDLIVNDPAVATLEEGRRVYPRRIMSELWLGRARGTAYIITDTPRIARADDPAPTRPAD